ncbi:hypothetical protein TrRE_jg5399, partial [Triparma retinervis]
MIVDFGTLDFHSAPSSSPSYDSFALNLTNLQVLSTTSRYSSSSAAPFSSLIEPFALTFGIQSLKDRSQTYVPNLNISANLPLLSFNITASVVRLIKRLEDKWRSKKEDRRGARRRRRASSSLQQPIPNVVLPAQPNDSPNPPSIVFDFTAPLIKFKLANDVEGRHNHRQPPPISPCHADILLLTITGVKTSFTKYKLQGSRITASLKSLDVADLYQRGPKSFSQLLSSTPQEPNSNPNVSDFITININDSLPESPGKEIDLEFHELYVNWNPETMAAIFYSIKIPAQLPSSSSGFVDVSSMTPDRASSPALSCASYASDDFFDANDDSDFDDPFEDTLTPKSPLNFFSPSANLDRSEEQRPTEPLEEAFQCPPRFSMTHPPMKPFKLTLTLSKLHVLFNKDSRKRRLVKAEVDATSVKFVKKETGGHRTDATLGNFTLSDNSTAGGTLYEQLIGLKTDRALAPDESSLTIRFETYERTNEAEGVKIDQMDGTVENCDSFLSLKLSPMKFVYMQQMWLEIIDYFFTGILGSEVWGGFNAEEEEQLLLEAILAKLKNPRRPSTSSSSFQGDNFAYLPDSDADGLRFLKFDIDIQSPILILPVHYRSRSNLQLDIGRLHVANYQRGEEEVDTINPDTSAMRMQYYNNCNISASPISLISSLASDKTTLTSADSPIDLSINIRWPMGDMIDRIVPRWTINCVFAPLCATLRRKDYALLCHMIGVNIQEDTRNMEEWINLMKKRRISLTSADSGGAYKDDDAFILYGYDIKNGKPTTYAFVIDISNITLNFVADEDPQQGVADIVCRDLQWSLIKKRDFITHQTLSCGSITLKQTSKETRFAAFSEILLPLEDCTGMKRTPSSGGLNSSFSGEAAPETEDPESSIPKVHNTSSTPQLLFTSISKPSGDNVKSLFIHDACIYLVYPTWMTVKSYFTNLPRAEILSVKAAREIIILNGEFFSTLSDTELVAIEEEEEEEGAKNVLVEVPFTTFQFRLLLSSARVVFPVDASRSDCDGVTLRCDADFLYEKLEEGGGNTDFFVHGLEVFTGVSKNPRRYSSTSSLLYPLSLRLKKVAGNASTAARTEVDIEVLKAKAKYTDLSLAVNVVVGLMGDMKEASLDIKQPQPQPADPCPENHQAPPANNFIESESESDSESTFTPKSTSVHCSGLSLLIIDNSERHFVGSKDLLSLSIADVSYSAAVSAEDETTLLVLRKLEVVDFLQSKFSPFRLLACSYPNEMRGTEGGESLDIGSDDCSARRLGWGVFCTKRGKDWGYDTHPTIGLPSMNENGTGDNLITIKKTTNLLSGVNVDIRCSTLVFQWNPGTVIALQRFLGRLMKEARSVKRDEVEREKKTEDHKGHLGGHSSKLKEKEKIGIKLGLKSLGVCMNKEHQGRRLLRLDLEDISVDFKSDEDGSKKVSASISALEATDPSTILADPNREVLRKIGPPGSILKIAYCRGGSEDDFVEEAKKLGAPSFFSSENYTSSLLVVLSSFRFNFLNSRTIELLDYLSNGLPGKGMGYTRSKAEDFYREKKDNLAIGVKVGAPELVVPRSSMSLDTTKCKLGDVSFSSWVEDGGRRAKGRVDGFGGGDILRESVNLEVDIVEKEGGLVEVAASISNVKATVKYSDWSLFHSIMMENLKLIDERRSENLERDEELDLIEGSRRVRYWVKREADNKKVGLRLKAMIKQETFQIVLVRNDDLVTSSNGSAYELCKVSLSQVECSINLEARARSTMQINIKRFNLMDLADRSGAFRDLVKGGREDDTEEIVITVGVGGDREKHVGLWLHDLTVFALAKPMVELAEFFKVAWPVGGEGGEVKKQGASQEEKGGKEEKGKEEEGEDDNDEDDEEEEHDSEDHGAGADDGGAKVARFRLEITAHKPRLFLLVDESNPSTKALVLRGLAKISMINGVASVDSKEDEPQAFGTLLPLDKVIKYRACSVKIDRLESYVNPGIDENDLGSALGIALIEPVSCESEYRMEKRALHPNLRTISFRLSGVKTLVSYTDIALINVVLKRWSVARAEAKRIRKEGAKFIEEGRAERERAKLEEKRAMELEGEREGKLEDEWKGIGLGADTSELQREECFDVVFANTGKLGLVLRKLGRNIVVETVKSPANALGIEVGDRLVSVDGLSVRRTEFKTVTEMLGMLPRPLTVRFGRPETNETEKSREKGNSAQNLTAFTAEFYDKFTGVSVKDSTHGVFMIVVSAIDENIYKRATTRIAAGEEVAAGVSGAPVPKVGAVVRSINGVMCNTLTREEVAKWLSGKTVGGSGSGPALVVEFIELPSDALGTVDRGSATVEGLKVTIIDDREGRDMPLMKALVEKIQVEFERASANGSLILKRGEGRGGIIYENTRRIGGGVEVRDSLKRGLVKRLSVDFLVGLDNYNPRVGTWEPLIEVAWFKVGVEV